MTRKAFIGIGAAAGAGFAIGNPKRGRIGSRRMFSDGENLPYDSEVEFIESTGTQWIDTGIISDATTNLVVTGHFSRLHGYTRIGCRNGPNNGQFCVLSTAENGIRLDMGSGDAELAQWIVQSDATEINLNAREKAARFVSPTGEEYFHSYNPTMSFSHYPILVFAFSNNGTPTIARGMVVSRVRISKSRVIIRNMIPVRFTNEYGSTEGAMYDLVSGEVFRNKGSGEFLIGPDV